MIFNMQVLMLMQLGPYRWVGDISHCKEQAKVKHGSLHMDTYDVEKLPLKMRKILSLAQSQLNHTLGIVSGRQVEHKSYNKDRLPQHLLLDVICACYPCVGGVAGASC